MNVSSELSNSFKSPSNSAILPSPSSALFVNSSVPSSSYNNNVKRHTGERANDSSLHEEFKWLYETDLFGSELQLDRVDSSKVIVNRKSTNPFYSKVINSQLENTGNIITQTVSGPVLLKVSKLSPITYTSSEFNHHGFEGDLQFTPLDNDEFDLEMSDDSVDLDTLALQGVIVPDAHFNPGESLGRPKPTNTVAEDLRNTRMKNHKKETKKEIKNPENKSQKDQKSMKESKNYNEAKNVKGKKEVKEVKPKKSSKKESKDIKAKKEVKKDVSPFAPPKYNHIRKKSSISSLKEFFKKSKEPQVNKADDKAIDADINGDNPLKTKVTTPQTPAAPYNNRILQKPQMQQVQAQQVQAQQVQAQQVQAYPSIKTQLQTSQFRSVKARPVTAVKPALRVNVPSPSTPAPMSAVGHNRKPIVETPASNPDYMKSPVFYFVSTFDDDDVEKAELAEVAEEETEAEAEEIIEIELADESDDSDIREITKKYSSETSSPDIEKSATAEFPFNMSRASLVLPKKSAAPPKWMARSSVISLNDKSLSSSSQESSPNGFVKVQNENTVTIRVGPLAPRMNTISESESSQSSIYEGLRKPMNSFKGSQTSLSPSSSYYDKEADNLLEEEGVTTQLIPEHELIDIEKDLQKVYRAKQHQEKLLQLQQAPVFTSPPRKDPLYYDLREVKEKKSLFNFIHRV